MRLVDTLPAAVQNGREFEKWRTRMVLLVKLVRQLADTMFDGRDALTHDATGNTPMEVLGQLIHELRSPLSLVLMKAEATGDGALERHAMRMECLLRYAAAAKAPPTAVSEQPIVENVHRAAELLRQSWEDVEVSCPGVSPAATAVLPEDEDMRQTLLAAWLETALYGTGERVVVVDVNRLGGVVLIEASVPGASWRGMASVHKRLCTQAAARLAGAVGGRLIVSCSLPHATLVLKRRAGHEQHQAGRRAA